MRVGRRLAIKLLNASKFVLAPAPSDQTQAAHAVSSRGAITAPVDRAMLRNLAALLEEATRDLESYDYARVLQRTEEFFWRFCDDYLELVKGRRYGEQGPVAATSANGALVAALSVLLRLFAPFLPFVTEEVWSWWQKGSIHRSAWPSRRELEELLAGDSAELRDADRRVLEWATEVLFEVRKQRSEDKQPMRVPISKVLITVPDASVIQLMPQVETDLKSALRVKAFETVTGDERRFEVTGYEPVEPSPRPAASGD